MEGLLIHRRAEGRIFHMKQLPPQRTDNVRMISYIKLGVLSLKSSKGQDQVQSSKTTKQDSSRKTKP